MFSANITLAMLLKNQQDRVMLYEIILLKYHRKSIVSSHALLYPFTSNHDPLFITINAKITRYEPRYKFI